MKLRKLLKYVSAVSPVFLLAEDASTLSFENKEKIPEDFYTDKVKGIGPCEGSLDIDIDTTLFVKGIEIYINRDNFDEYYDEEE